MGKKNVYLEWAEIPAGILKGATDRFWAALGSEAGLVATRINLDPKYVSDLANLAATLAFEDRKIPAEEEKVLDLRKELGVKFVSMEKFLDPT